MGDDLPDLGLAAASAAFFAPANARPEIKDRADVVCAAGGGRGAVRELAETILRAKGGLAPDRGRPRRMRRLVLFLLLVAVGLAVLLWVDSRLSPDADDTSTPARGQPDAPVDPDPPPTPPVRPEDQELPGEPVEIPEEGGGKMTVLVTGPLELSELVEQTGRRLWRLNAEEVLSLGDGAFDLTTVALELFDPENGELGRSLDSATPAPGSGSSPRGSRWTRSSPSPCARWRWCSTRASASFR